jgi:predicted MFS family arabinose efflux permease
VLGPLLRAVLVDSLSWRIAFLVNVPLVIIALYATLRHVPESRDENAPRSLDWLGSFVVALAIGGISFGLVRGQERQWNDGLAFAALGVGIVAAVLFPIMMLRRRDPLIPPDLFRRRNFTVINISTFLIYGALYVTLTVQSLFLQGVLGYTALGASAIGLPVGIFLSLGSTRVGTLAGRLGPRRFLIIGPLLMAAAMLWFARAPATSRPWQIDLANSATWLPPGDVLIDIVPAILLFGVGITLVVAPLTTALMNSIPVRNAGLGSAINNAVSRVGQPLIMAILFIAISATFYSSISGHIGGLDTASADVRQQIQPLNPPKSPLPPDQQAAVTQASTDAFHLAMLVNVALLLAGAGANALGLRRGAAAGAAEDTEAGVPAGEAAEGVPSAG